MNASLRNERMVSIYMGGEDKAKKFTDWAIWSDKYEALQLTCHFPSKKKYTRPLSDCRVVPMREIGTTLLTERGSVVTKPIEKATIYGERYAVVHFLGTAKPYLYKLDNIGFVTQTAMKEAPVFSYLVAVANARRDRAGSPNQQQIAANVVRQLEKLLPRPDTALNAYCTGHNGTQTMSGGLIYPFGVNESQLAAVEQAFSAQISVIEGPPGTGKTQTILNILANILLRGKTVAILSNNNAAVENVYEKLEKFGLDHLVAKLGSKENREDFFANLPPWPSAEPEPAPTMDEIQAMLARLKQHLHDHNRAAQLQADIDELTIERRYLQQWWDENGVQIPASLDKYGLSPRKTADLMAYLSYLGEQRIRLKDRIELLLKFKIFRSKPLAKDARLSFFHALQLHYYDKTLKEKGATLRACRESLARGHFTALLEALTTGSMRYLKHHVHAQARASHSFDAQTYRQQFDAFMQRFPILGSSTHSIVNSIAQGAILDYVIIDEASQQDIVPGILALGCAKNLIVVGDSRQLAHIPVTLGLQAPADVYDCERYSLLDSCIGVFKDTLPRTLLKEHYRCHPRIIQFCNQQFYGNALVPMTQDNGEEAPLRLLVTAKGNHVRKNTNLRELDSLLKVLEDEAEPVRLESDGRGFIAPFRAQVTLAGKQLPADFAKDTVHKFQGRECDEIVFSTVLDKKRSSLERLDFVDDPRMVNVAVSRAKSRFTLVTGDEVFSANNGHIAALIRYVEYYAQDGQIVRAPVVSAFDLLYKEYDQSLARLNSRLRPEDSRYKSEQIVAALLRAALSDASLEAITFYTQIALNQLASSTNPALTARELAFMRNRASCDFVLYFKVGKTPLGVIEVDGGTHDEPEQAARDALKDSILAKSNLPILRLRTVESGIEEKIAGFLSAWARASANEEPATVSES
ncbi:AAA domain-containing protein [Ralstonia pseudosolanacearum]|uniref:AAA domain-containing protein n=1 Tax=Ralstonia pseudosolanacearum TaxID=1310165 RepID=UPI003AAE5443